MSAPGWESLTGKGWASGLPGILLIERPGFNYEPFFEPSAPVAYPDNFTLFGFLSTMIMFTREDPPINIILTVDGVTELPERETPVDGLLGVQAVGFKVKLATGAASAYTLIALQ